MTIAPADSRQALVDRLVRGAMRGGDEPEPENDLELPPEPYDYAKDFWLARPYFARDYAGHVMERFADHVQSWETGGYGAAVFNAYRAYHNLSGSGTDDDPITQLQAAGEVGELLALTLPHYRTLVRHQIALFTSERPAWDPQARTTDAAASRQVPMAVNLLDYVLSTGDIDQRLAEQCELMMVAGAGFFITGWDAGRGLGGRGWFTERVCAPWEIAHERVRTYDDVSWWIYRAHESRWDWVARFAKLDPEKAERIAQLDQSDEDFGKYGMASSDFGEEADRIAVLYVIARPTVACPEGRMSIVAGEDLVLFDGPYPYGEDIVVSRMCASEFLGTSIPYADSWGVLAPADAYNAMMSMIVTRVDTCGVPNFCVTEGSDIDYADIAGGNNVWKIAAGGQQPNVVDLLQIPDAMPGLLQMLGGEMEKATGINSVTRGQPTENVSSGSMAALLQSMAQQFNSPLERAWALNLERIGTHHIRVFQKMADEEHAISVVGVDEKWTLQEFRGEDLSGILRVAVKTASALSKTTAGRAEIATKLLEHKLINNPQEYLQVIQTGQLQPVFAGPVGELNSIKSRCEKLMRGEKAPPLLWDNHQLCIREFKELLNTEARNDPAIVSVVHETAQAHYDLWAKLSREDPDRLVAIGCPPLPQALQVGQQAQAMQAQGMAPGAPPGAAPNMPPPPRQVEQPNTEEPKGKPGPAPSPPGAQPSQAHPSMPRQPSPAKTPDGRSVV